uniref:RNA ligase domain-containing protein n=1 Tax=viral metagenome TaxID=1070528 RepID=A0A6C0H5K2_9ZZZZ
MFSEYEHMINDKKIKEMDKMELWVATEKIHGTNLSFICRGTDEIVGCRRHGILKNGEYFMNYEKILEKYKKDMLGINEEIKKEYKDLNQIQIYGELFGGNYNGKKENGSIKIQKGIDYIPNNDYMVFDIKIMLNSGEIFYYDFDKLIKLLSVFELKLVPIIKIDVIDEILKLDPVFESMVYMQYGLPKIKGNNAEGYVIKMIKGENRSIFKYKNPSFNEIKMERVELAPKVKNRYISIILNYVCENRFNNVKTKLVNEKEIYDALYEDLMVDFLEDNSEISENELNECKKIVKNVIKNRVDKWI